MNHTPYIQRCLELAARGKSHVAPNPMVGAVLVHNGRIIGEGWHRVYGQAHAEVNCFEDVTPADKHLIPESTMYVSLEPCAHYGKTPPCALRIVQERVKEVIICNVDPFEKVGGKGLEILHSNGIRTETNILREHGLWFNRRFFCFHEQKRPYIILKWAQSADGFMAPADKSRTQLSNAHSRQLLHKWRTEESAIMVGYNTALHDDPELTARYWEGPQPLRIVLDKQLQLPATAKLRNTAAKTWVINAVKETEEDNVHFIRFDFEQDILPQLMQRLHAAGKLSLIVEGGAALLNSFIKAGLWDEARIFHTAPVLGDGISAPKLYHADAAFSTTLAGDELQVLINLQSKYAYVPGMEL
ncbi:bifunctional diaminohydroxyphosphoribosylaminopyrimidine deaminase/5-amino-6-(5-phosphoribosylamino)uracil reductase RibD [Chitinophagaceae bacterium MMS25-I14]